MYHRTTVLEKHNSRGLVAVDEGTTYTFYTRSLQLFVFILNYNLCILVHSGSILVFKLKNKLGIDNFWPATLLPAKNDSDVMFCLQSYLGLIIDRSCINPIRRIGIIHKDISIHVCSSGVNMLMVYLTIVNTILRHCHSWLARQ